MSCVQNQYYDLTDCAPCPPGTHSDYIYHRTLSCTVDKEDEFDPIILVYVVAVVMYMVACVIGTRHRFDKT
jgi:hypothetical protein